MPARFTEVTAPLEERVQSGVLAALHEVASSVVNMSKRVGAAVPDETAAERLSQGVLHAVRPTGPTFVLLVLVACAFLGQRVLVRMETNRILRSHGSFALDDNHSKTR